MVAEDDILRLGKAMVSVGFISYSRMTGTVFRVGTSYVMTAAHIVRDIVGNEKTVTLRLLYGKTCLKRPFKKMTKIDFQDRLSLNAGQKYCRMLQGEHSAILSTFIKPPFVIQIFVWSILSDRLRRLLLYSICVTCLDTRSEGNNTGYLFYVWRSTEYIICN